MADLVEEAVEDLTIQQVILSSLEDQTWDGIEEERSQVLREVERLKRLVKKLTREVEVHTDDKTDVGSSASQVASPSGSSNKVACPSPRTLAVTGGRSIKMDSSPGHHDTWDNTSSTSLPSRKRDLGATDGFTMERHNKSRRTTPAPGPDRSSTPSRPVMDYIDTDPMDFDDVEPMHYNDTEPMDIIDLTGDDVDLNSTMIAEQLRQQRRHAQEALDRQMALQLTSQNPMAQPSFADITPGGVDAFSKIMPPARANTGGPSGWNRQFLPTSSTQTPPPPTDLKTASMPGSYNPNWDSPSPWDRSPIPNPAPLPSNGFQVAGINSPRPNHQGPLGGNAPPSTPYPSMRSQLSNPALRNAFHPSPSPRVPFHGALQLPGNSGPHIARIIETTSTFDFTTGLDVFGYPLPSRLANVFPDDDDESPVTGKELDDLLGNIRPDIDIPEHNRGVGPPGLKFPLYRHQEVALTWMKHMEEGTNKGGILADDMGLGKTISTISLMLANPSTSRRKTNLIIGPLSLIRQWEEELQKKTKLSHRFSVFVYHSKKSTTDELLKHDVVLTTYGTLAQELRRREKFIEENKDRNIDFNDKSCAARFPLLHPEKAVFHRIILDEAQCIKNKATQTAKACHSLRATYRWCLTGTPMMNGILELYSLLKFLRIKPYNTWETFRQTFGKLFGQNGDSKSSAMNKLRALLKAIMLRRKKDSKLDGQPILQLPPKTEHIVYADLSVDERDFYKQLEEKAQVVFSKYLREGSVGKNYSNILVLLLRLRQACCHPHLNLDVDDAATPISDEEVEKLVKELDGSIVERIKGVEAFECPICYDAVQSPSFFIPCGHDSCKDCLSRIVDNAISQNIHEGNESDKAKCPVCRGVFEPKKCFTYDLFRKVHMPETVGQLATMEPEYNDSSDDEDGSQDEYLSDEIDSKGNLKGFVVYDDDDDDDELADIDDLSKTVSAGDAKAPKRTKKTKNAEKGKEKGKKKGKDKAPDVRPSMLKSLRLEAAKNREAYRRYMRYLRKTWMPAAKVTECMKLLTQIRETGEKTIIFSQWTLLLDLLEVAMRHEQFPDKPLRYDGSMSGDERSAAARSFRDQPQHNVMLVSLRAGNAGLNLTAATRVIIMDPFWNPYIEMQAIDRTYRIGQQKPVEVYRILARATVEDRIVELQNKKKEIVEAALDETESMKIGRLGVNELRFLFGTD